MTAWIACLALIALDGPDSLSPASDARAAYEARRQATGRSPDEQVRLAYWCEAHGLSAERLRHLALAVLADPDHAAARGLLGLVSRDRRWLKPEAVTDRVQADAALSVTLAEYDTKRAATPYTAEAQWNLATWAVEHGLAAQARAHFTAVVRLDPKRDAAWKRLGYKKVDGRWTTEAEQVAARADADAQKAADKRWRPLFEKWRAQLARPSQRAEAEAGLLSVTDPRAVRWVTQTFLDGAKPNAEVALRVLSQIDSAASSRLIMGLALDADNPNTRRLALETLRQRDPREFADIAIRRLRSRLEYEVQPVGGPGSVGRLVIKEPKQRIQRLYNTPAVPNYLAWLSEVGNGDPTMTYHYQGQRVENILLESRHSIQELRNWHPTNAALATRIDQFLYQGKVDYNHLRPGQTEKSNIPNIGLLFASTSITPLQTDTTIPVAAMIAEYNKAAFAARQQMATDISSIDAYNRQVAESNDRTSLVLRTISGVDHGTDQAVWTSWLVNLNGFALAADQSSEVPTYTVDVPLAYQPQPLPIGQMTYNAGPTKTITTLSSMGIDCFGAGTLVRTLTGPRAIETLAVGDLVLTQSTSTGALRYSPVLMVHRNPPSPTFLIQLPTEAITSSPFHRFWKAGVGWVMARDLRAGDQLRLLDGTVRITESGVGAEQPVFNLDIADDADFFAGASAALVHDHTLPDSRLVPFDRVGADDQALTARP